MNRDRDFSLNVPGLEIVVGGGGFGNRIGFGEGGRNRAAFRQIAQNAEILFVNIDAEDDKLLLLRHAGFDCVGVCGRR